MEFRGLMGGFYRISEWIMRLSVTNVLWIVTAFPAFFFILTIMMAQDEAQVQASLFAIAVLSPFTLFPSTSAMFALARKWVMGDADVGLLRTFFRSYKENYKQSMFGGIIFIVLLVVLFFNLQFYSSQGGYAALLTYLFIALMVLLVVSIFNFFCITVHLHMKTLQVVKNAVLITVGQPFRSILISLSCAAILYISFTQFNMVLLPFFTGSVIAMITFWHFHNGFRKIMDKQQKLEAERAEKEAEGQDANETDGKM